MSQRSSFSILFILACCLPIFSSAQEDSTLIKKGDEYQFKAVDFFGKNQIDSALANLIITADFYQRGKSPYKYASTLNDIAFVYYYQKRFTEFEPIAFKAYEYAIKHLEPDHEITIRSHNTLQAYYYSIGNFDRTIDILKKLLNIRKKKKDNKLEIATNYLNLANAYKFNGDQENAFNYLQKALNIQLDTLPNAPITGETYKDIGLLFHDVGELDSALVYFNRAEAFLAPVDSKSPLISNKVDNLILTASTLNKKREFAAAEYYLEKAKKILSNDFYKIKLLETQAEIHFSQNEFNQALNFLEEANQIAEQSDKKNTPPYHARRFQLKGDIYSKQGKLSDAIANYHQVLLTLSPVFTDQEVQNNPKPEQFLSPSDALKGLQGKAQSFFRRYLQNNSLEDLQAAYHAYRVATELIRDIRQGIIGVESKKTLSEKSVAIYEGAIQTALELYHQEGDPSYQSAAFLLAESNKALLLLENINEQAAKGFAGIPDSLLRHEKDLKIKIAHFQKQLLETQDDPNAQNNLKADIFAAQQKLNQLTEDFENNFPRYYALKYQNDPVDLEHLQTSLVQQDQVLLEYFVGEQSIYLFLVTPTELHISQINESEQIADAVWQLRSILATPPGEGDAQAAFVSFTEAAYLLFDKLVLIGLVQLETSYSRLVIIPDDLLNYLPFNLLLSEPANPNHPGYGPSQLHYLLEDYPIGYHYSATLLYKSQQQSRRDFAYEFIGFAPSFREGGNVVNRSCTADELYSLRCSESEIAAISELLNGKQRLGSAANTATFTEQAANYRILHLATHACVDETDANRNKIFFTDDFLTNEDLYNLDLQTELAVLSACNTGFGELVRGEGVMSLARAFIQAGCQSTLLSMWAVDDCATSELMVGFYEALESGAAKDEALQRAQLAYLEAANKSKQHPYYWGAFAQYGNARALSNSSPNWWWFGGIGLVILGLIGWRFFKT